MNNHYLDFTAADFVADDHFFNWVLRPDSENSGTWEKWLKKHPEKKEEVNKAIRIITSLQFEDDASLSPARENQLIDKINTKINSSEVLGNEKSRSKVRALYVARKFRAVAAVFLGVVLLGIGAYFVSQATSKTVIKTVYAEKKNLELPDGSTVTLNANSSLSFEEEWSKREVWLEGEAFFEVEKATSQSGPPQSFVVHSENLDIEVLGTSFNVGERRGETKVTLLTGKVKLQNKLIKDAAPLFLTPGEHAEVSTTAKDLKKERVDVEKYASWLEDRLVFEATPLSEIKNILEDNFGYKVVFKNSNLANRNFTGVIRTDDLDVFIETLELSFNVNVTKKGEKLIFQSN